MPAADGVDARARRVAARLLPTRVRRAARRPWSGDDAGRGPSGAGRHLGAGHPARAARVTRAVRALEAEGWISLGQVRRPGDGRRLIDHVIVGHGGVVVVDSQAWVGRIEVTRGVVQQNGFWREPECAEVARTAGSVAALLPPQHRSCVHAVICVAQHDLPEHHVAPGVHVVGVTGLARMLRRLPPRLQPTDILRLHTQLRHELTEFAPPEQLTTAAFDLTPHFGRPACVVDEAGMPGPARRARAGRPVRRPDLRLLGARLLLAGLVATAAIVLGPALLHHPVETAVPTRPVSPPTVTTDAAPAASAPPGLPEPAPTAPSAALPTAPTAREDHHRPSL